VAHGEGPCLVVAGPGSGKTRVIVERFLSLIDRGVDPGAQLVLTYTRKAAQEMLERAEASHGAFSIDPPLSNYHSYAQRVVRDWGWLIGVAPGFHIADDAERWLKPKTLWNPLRPHDLIDPLLHLIGQAKQELVTPESYTAWAAQQIERCDDPAEMSLLERHRECAQVYAALEDRYRTRAVLDHDDCIRLAELLIREHPAARRGIAGRVQYVMVDEYQDTNFAQARLVEALVSDHHNILVVADDDQAIYKFRGASLANLERFSRTYPQHKRIVLGLNYRSTPQIVAAAVIDQAPASSRIGKELAATRERGVKVDVWRADDERAEMEVLAGQCRDLIEAGTRPSEIAWLFRRHIDMQSAMTALAAANVPYEVHGGRGFFTSREIKDCWALLNAVDTPDDSQALLRCLHFPAWRVSNRGRLLLTRAAREHDIPLFQVLENGGVEDLDAGDAQACARAIAAITELSARTDRDDIRDLFFDALDASEFMSVLDEADLPARIQAGANLNKFAEMLENFADWSDDRRVGTALRYLDVLRNSRDADELAPVANTGAGIILVTAHSAKGLEWPVVIVPRCIIGRWPDTANTARRLALPNEIIPETTPAGDNDIDEERRLFYVAITRARDRLILSSAAHYARSYSDERRSPFLEAAVARGDDVELRAAPPSVAPPRRRSRSGGGLPSERPHFAVMDVAAFAACPRKFEYRKRFRLPVRQTQQAWYGNLIHTVLQSAAMRRSAGTAIDTASITEIWHEAWQAAGGEKGRWQSLRELGREQLAGYIKSPGWLETEIVDVESSFTLPMTAADVSGRFDRVDRRSDGVTTIVDYKTGPPKSAEQVSRDLQVRAYGVAGSQRDQTDQVAVELHYLQTAEVVRVVLKAKELDRAYRHLSASTADMASAWNTGSFTPKPSAWLCRRCEYRTVCDEGQASG
jgi:ATP-dependent DNA helicase UvrD/PcrA